MVGGIERTPFLKDSMDCCRDIFGVGGWLNRKFGLADGPSRTELARVATPGFCMTERRRTGMYRDKSELARLIVVLGGFVGCVGLELFHVVSVTTVILFSDIVAASSNLGSSVRFSRRLAS
jgi:hypothetical protein